MLLKPLAIQLLLERLLQPLSDLLCHSLREKPDDVLYDPLSDMHCQSF